MDEVVGERILEEVPDGGFLEEHENGREACLCGEVVVLVEGIQGRELVGGVWVVDVLVMVVHGISWVVVMVAENVVVVLVEGIQERVLW
ncbi:hypothetical protein Leryth_017099 [Lithospermum erythrorhizon]|nr:hypothetical protein Leryth_017099 [Lithospermum erythrorhizon]